MTLFIIKEVTERFDNQIQTLLLLLDLDLLVFIIIFLLASKSCLYRLRLPSTVTLRLGRVLKASPVPLSIKISNFSELRLNLLFIA